MEDYDWIQIAYLLETEPSVETYESLFSRINTHLDRPPRSDEVEVVYWDDEDERNETAEEYDGAAQIASEYPTVKVLLETTWDDISIGFEKQGVGFPSYESTPFLRFTTWIYTLEDTDEEAYQEEVEQYRREFAEIHALAADVLGPKWGFGRRGGLAIGENDSIEELASTTTPPLYEYNVFRPETVEELGRERVLSAPAWYVQELDSGGVFLAVREPPKQCSSTTDACLDVADHLGIPLGKIERYH
ncbi:hypothetical protein SAMN05216559_1916 [Halomicrobium zhouii]|uniref:Uncharacterized protein n=1 Tax=Halomicrobium zhouii TaxID=767519 RepID=A0A1I6L3D7_9EURY|nr:hypothetical protein [Halomicrobium zhouii]SFR97798.1 hypothetical protein SAMN05216559_1916 [Halomicrobium zhouii]